MHTRSNLEMDFKLILEDAQKRYEQLYSEDKKTFALRVLDEAKEISSILFNMYEGKKFEQVIWKIIRPKFSKAFKVDNDA